MPAQEHLSPQLFHGTTQHFKVGDVILPASSIDKNVHRKDRPVKNNALDRAWAAPNPLSAKSYARSRSSSQGELFGYVYQVEPVDWNESETDNSMDYSKSESMDVSSFRDKGVVDDFPFSVHSKKGFRVTSSPTIHASDDAFVTPDEALYDHKGRKLGHPSFRQD